MYLRWNQKTITDFSPQVVNELYNQGYVFTRLHKGSMDQTRSARIVLSAFELSSENRRILKKVEDLTLEAAPLPYKNYDWQIGKMATDFYKERNATFSANKIKEILTDPEKNNFNTLLVFQTKNDSEEKHAPSIRVPALGYTICFTTHELLHYSYPFYKSDTKDVGLGMMLKSLIRAKEQGLMYVYLGSLQRPSDTYKLQFQGLEWFDGKKWSTDIEKAKEELKTLI